MITNDLLRQALDELAHKGVDPIYIVDTGAVIELEERDPLGLRVFLNGRDNDCLLTGHVLDELRTHNNTFIGRRREIADDTLARFEEIYGKTRDLLQLVTGHPMYDTHRYRGRGTAHEMCREKKRKRDPISISDTHTLALAMTLAEHGRELGMPNRYPVLMTEDEHLYHSVACFANPGSPQYRPTYQTIKILRVRP